MRAVYLSDEKFFLFSKILTPVSTDRHCRPTHAWPYANTKAAKAAQATATQHQSQDTATIAQLQAQLASMNCPPHA